MVDGLTFRDSVRGFLNESAEDVGSEGWLERVADMSSDKAELENLTCFCEYRKVVSALG